MVVVVGGWLKGISGGLLMVAELVTAYVEVVPVIVIGSL